jgi:hypothetical protein
MTAVREIVDSSSLAGIFDLPPFLRNRKIEVFMYPAEEEKPKKLPKVTRAQMKEWAQAPELQAIAGILKGADLPPDFSMKDVREMRLAEKYGI